MALDSTSTSNRDVTRTRTVSTTSRTGSDDLAANLDRDMSAVTPAQLDTAARTVSSATPTDDTVARVGSTHTVQRGDTLSHIARDNGVSLRQLIEANPQIRNPDRIYPGQQVNIPAGGAPRPGVPGTGTVDGLARGARGPEVEALQRRLNDLGYQAGQVDGSFGPITQGALRNFQMSNDLPTTGRVDDATRARLDSPEAQGPRRPAPGEYPQLSVYPPGSPEQVALFQEAARQAGLPEEWASSRGLINLLNAESGGKVGVPNYTYGARARDPSQWGSVHDELKSGRITARSSATGLGQLLLSNVDRYYPSGRQGIGNPMEEAVGMMRYIQDRYGSPDAAWRRYNTAHEGY